MLPTVSNRKEKQDALFTKLGFLMLLPLNVCMAAWLLHRHLTFGLGKLEMEGMGAVERVVEKVIEVEKPLEKIVEVEKIVNVEKVVVKDFSPKDGCTTKDLALVLPLHHKDIPLASTLFFSIERIFDCFQEFVVIVPPESEFAVAGSIPSYVTKIFVTPDPLPPKFGYLSQQIIKLHTDLFTLAPRVLILEADQIFVGYQEQCYFGVDEKGDLNGKVKAYCIDYEKGGNKVWRNGTTHAVGGGLILMDCCVSTPFAFPRDVFPALREHLEKLHNKPIGQLITDYFYGHSRGWTQESRLFSEFNILIHFMLRHRPDLVELVKPQNSTKWAMKVS